MGQMNIDGGSAALFGCPVLHYKRNRRRFRVTDEAAALVAETVPVVGGEGKSKLKAMFSNPDTGPLILQVTDPAGTPLYSMERHGTIPLVLQPIWVSRPDGSPVGRIAPDDPIMRQTDSGEIPMTQRFKIIDSHRNVLASIVWEPTPRGVPFQQHHPSYCDFFTADEAKFGHFEDDSLSLDGLPPRPLHELVVLSPIAFVIMDMIT